jgi:mannose-6-phosphate isomerase-like protein (cupin superfamily)
VSTSAPNYDPSDFKLNPYLKRIDKPWGYELHFVPESAPYMGKMIHINKGSRLSLQIHELKVESWFVIKGSAAAEWEDSKGQMLKTELLTGSGYSISLGQKHRLIGITDCDIIEVSSPEKGTTWRIEDDYLRPDETPEVRKKERTIEN